MKIVYAVQLHRYYKTFQSLHYLLIGLQSKIENLAKINKHNVVPCAGSTAIAYLRGYQTYDP
jgi:hypothetical protein